MNLDVPGESTAWLTFSPRATILPTNFPNMVASVYVAVYGMTRVEIVRYRDVGCWCSLALEMKDCGGGRCSGRCGVWLNTTT